MKASLLAVLQGQLKGQHHGRFLTHGNDKAGDASQCAQDQHLGCFASEFPTVIKGPLLGIAPRVSHRPCPGWQRCVSAISCTMLYQFSKLLWNISFYLLLLVCLDCKVERWRPCDRRKQVTQRLGDHSQARLAQTYWPTLKVLESEDSGNKSGKLKFFRQNTSANSHSPTSLVQFGHFSPIWQLDLDRLCERAFNGTLGVGSHH